MLGLVMSFALSSGMLVGMMQEEALQVWFDWASTQW